MSESGAYTYYLEETEARTHTHTRSTQKLPKCLSSAYHRTGIVKILVLWGARIWHGRKQTR